MVLPLILGIGAAIFGGAYVGTVVENATAAPTVSIKDATLTEEPKALTRSDLLKAGVLGIGAYFIYKKFLKGR